MARRTWHTPEGIVFEGIQTGDGRIFVPGALTWDAQPNGWPYRVSFRDEGGHFGAEVVGAIDSMARSGGGAISATGWIEDSITAGAELVAQHEAGVPRGVSVDLDDMAVEFVATGEADDDDVILAASLPVAQLRHVVPDPGAPDRFEVHLVAAGLPALVAAATEMAAQRGLTAAGWRAPALVAAAGDGDPDGVILFADSMDEVVLRVTRGRIRGATDVDLPAYHRAAIVLDGATTDDPADDDEPAEEPADDDADAARADTAGCSDCAAHAARVTAIRDRNPDLDPATADALAALTAAGAAAPMRPPAGWYRNPEFGAGDVVEVKDSATGRTLRGVPMRYQDDGQVFGHVALWGQCHTGSADGQCVLTPRSRSGYAYFRHGVTVLDDGTEVATGNLTVGGGHADVTLSYRAALDHYDNVGTLAATVVAGEDDYGVWVAGAGMPDVWDDELRLRKLRAASPSGDWRYIGGALDLAHTHAVNAPGFPVPRVGMVAGAVRSLVAAGAGDLALVAAGATGAPAEQVDVAAIVDATIARMEARNAEAAAARRRLVAAGETAIRRRAVRRILDRRPVTR